MDWSISALTRIARVVSLAAIGLGVTVIPAAAQSETVEYYGLDALGSVRVIFNAQGVVVDRMDYGPFGENLRAAIKFPVEQFAQLARDAESGQDYAEARNYSAGSGRLNRVDPVYAGLFNPQAWNRYAYAANNPLRFVDPEGLQFRTTSVPACVTFICDMPRDFGGGAAEIDLMGMVDDAGEVGGSGLPQSPAIPAVPPLPGTVPALPAGTPDDFHKPFADAFTEADDRLLKNRGCSAVFGGTDNARTSLFAAEYRFVRLPQPSEPGHFTAAATQRESNRVLIDPRGPFIKQTQFVPGRGFVIIDQGTRLRGAEFGALLLLHELGHLTGEFGPDAGNSPLNKKYTNRVYKACF
jgi:RHS repeat-associated protein